MQQEKKPLTREQLFEQVAKSIKPDATLLEDLERIVEGMEYKEHLTEFGESAPETQIFLVEHPEAKKNLEFAKKAFSRVGGS